jgi:ELWxxDGT repeat protein
MKSTLLTILIFLAIGAGVNAQQLELAADINLDGSDFSRFTSRPSGFTAFNSKLYFSARGPKTGQELFSYDGTDVELVADLNADLYDSKPIKLTVFNNKLYFIANQANGSAYLYSYDGVNTPSVVVDLTTEANYANYVQLFQYNSKLHFTTFNDTTDIYSIWEYDGVSTPSVIHSEASSSIGSDFRAFVELNGDLYFYKSGSSQNNSTYYVYDGVNPPSVAPNSSIIFFISNEAIVYNNKIYLVSYEPTGNIGQELWSYDGINTPTLVSDIYPGTSSSSIKSFTVFNNKLYFSATDGVSGEEFWSYDGTTVSQVADINLTGNSRPSDFIMYNNKLHFSATDGVSGTEIYEYDGLNAPAIAEEIRAGAGGTARNLAVFQNNLLFAGDEGLALAEELYLYDGTDITLVANIFDGSDGSSPRYITEYKNKIYFSAYGDPEYGVELYSFDGVNAALVADLDTAHTAWAGAASSSSPTNLIVFNNLLYFRANDGSGYKTWKYDGVTAPSIATELLGDSYYFHLFNNKLYYTGNDGINGSELWEYDGVNPTSMVSDIASGSTGSYPEGYFIFNNKLIFAADNGVNGEELWQYDGVNAPTMLADVFSGTKSSYPSAFQEFNGALYFNAMSDTIIGSELMVYDGINPPSLVHDIYPGSSNGYPNESYPYALNVINNKLVFIAVDSAHGSELWEYDGTNTPTRVTDYDVTGFSANQQFASITAVDSVLYFWCDNGTNIGSELFKYDGTGLPVMFDEVNIGTGNSRPNNSSNIMKFDGYIYLAANDGVLGYSSFGELYKIKADSTLSIQSLAISINNLEIYPNPVQNELFIELEEGQITALSIFDLSGRLVKSITKYTAKSVDVSGLQQGMYILKVQTTKGVSATQFIKQ